MTTLPPSMSFASSTASCDAIAVLVLIETSGMMHGLWDNVRAYYLPLLLDTLRSSNPSISMRICWQTTTSMARSEASGATAAPTGNTDSANQIPAIHFDSSSSTSISGASLRHAIETLRSAFQQSRRPCRHLILVAANTPLEDFSGGTQVLHSLAYSLLQNDIRLHMVLSSGPQVQPLRELHQRTLHLQHSPAITPWFEVDSSQYQLLLSGDPVPRPGARSPAPLVVPSQGTSSVPSQSPPRPESLRTMSASSPLPVSSSPPLGSSVTETLLSAIPRVPRGKGNSSPPAQSSEPPRLGLVSYLQQMHGLTKKRTYGSKTSKRGPGGAAATSTAGGSSSAGESSRLAANRPILPRLDLPVNKPHGWTPYPKVSSSDLEKSPGSSSASQKHATSSTSTTSSAVDPSSSEGSRGNHPRRFPWILPAPLPASSERSPQIPGSPQSLYSQDMPVSPTTSTPFQQQHSVSASSRLIAGSHSDRSHSHTMQKQSPSASHPAIYGAGVSSAPGVTHQGFPSSQAHHNRTNWNPSPQFDHGYSSHSYHPHYGAMPPTTEDPSDQPFIITPEYEARANAQFEEAVRSGAMEASMTSATLSSSPSAGSPHPLGYSQAPSSGYFPDPGSHGSAFPSAIHSPMGMMTQQQQQMQMQMPVSQGYYHYDAQGAPYVHQDDPGSVGHEDPTRGSSSSHSGPTSSHHLHHHAPSQSGYDSSADRWYGT
ncbi:unnamed protein product [Somion occarium]|uniref:VWFA domain-containing protein n=1 Tax=Somion occarium TaxID=3059160 RepID=A0ABP1D3M9_9APHY